MTYSCIPTCKWSKIQQRQRKGSTLECLDHSHFCHGLVSWLSYTIFQATEVVYVRVLLNADPGSRLKYALGTMHSLFLLWLFYGLWFSAYARILLIKIGPIQDEITSCA